MADEETARKVEWFHQFARQSAEELAAQASEENRALLHDFVCMCLRDQARPPHQPPEKFALDVLALRENERQWNQALMSALVQADDRYKETDWRGAVTTARVIRGGVSVEIL